MHAMRFVLVALLHFCVVNIHVLVILLQSHEYEPHKNAIKPPKRNALRAWAGGLRTIRKLFLYVFKDYIV